MDIQAAVERLSDIQERRMRHCTGRKKDYGEQNTKPETLFLVEIAGNIL
jgi:hypothetical protein